MNYVVGSQMSAVRSAVEETAPVRSAAMRLQLDLDMNINSFSDADERQIERRKRLEAERVAAGLPKPTWEPPTAEQIKAHQDIELGRRK